MSSASREKTLILMRHAKAEEGPGKVDHDRELAARGRRDAKAAGKWLHAEGLVPDLVICSTAQRTRQTWEEACRGGAHTEFVEFRRSVYLGGSEQTLETVREDAGDTSTVLVVGHNPTMAQLTSLLTDGEGARGPRRGLRHERARGPALRGGLGRPRPRHVRAGALPRQPRSRRLTGRRPVGTGSGCEMRCPPSGHGSMLLA